MLLFWQNGFVESANMQRLLIQNAHIVQYTGKCDIAKTGLQRLEGDFPIASHFQAYTQLSVSSIMPRHGSPGKSGRGGNRGGGRGRGRGRGKGRNRGRGNGNYGSPYPVSFIILMLNNHININLPVLIHHNYSKWYEDLLWINR